MSHENAARRLNRFKDDNDDDGDDDGIFVQSPFVSARASSFPARDTRSRPLFAGLILLPFSLRPTNPLTKTNGTYLFRGTPASGFLLSPLCIALVKYFSAFSFPFIPLFVPRFARPRFSVRPRRSLAAIGFSYLAPLFSFADSYEYTATTRRFARMYELSKQSTRSSDCLLNLASNGKKETIYNLPSPQESLPSNHILLIPLIYLLMSFNFSTILTSFIFLMILIYGLFVDYCKQSIKNFNFFIQA